MKTKKWLLHLAIILINLVRLAISCVLFYRFFLFRMAEVSALYIFYLLLDSAEGIIVFFHKNVWRRAYRVVCQINSAILLFAVIAGIVLYLPLFYFAADWEIELTEKHTFDTWLFCTIATFLTTAVSSYAVNDYWGNIQNLAARFTFLGYCSYQLYPERAALIPLIVIAAACIVGIEIKKYGWSFKELRKKDYRFRHPEKTAPVPRSLGEVGPPLD